jgi:hypothetical protein
MDKLFDKIEIIPLETTEESLIRAIYKYDYMDGKHYILDETQSILFIFDDEGNYQNRIAKKGQGPGEYTLIYDFTLNPKKRQIEMLSPFKFIYCYDFAGNFIKKFDLISSIKPPNIKKMKILDDENYVLWSSPEDNEDAIRIISQETGEVRNSFWQDIFIINSWTANNVFYQYDNACYFSFELYNKVYKVTKDGFKVAYEWDFGDKTLDISKYKISTGMYNYNKDAENLIERIKSGEVPYSYLRHFHNKQYYYTELNIKGTTAKHVFYNKKTGKSYLHECAIRDFIPLYFSDAFIIGRLDSDVKDKLLDNPLLDEANRQKLLFAKEDDNPFLAKYYFNK